MYREIAGKVRLSPGKSVYKEIDVKVGVTPGNDFTELQLTKSISVIVSKEDLLLALDAHPKLIEKETKK